MNTLNSKILRIFNDVAVDKSFARIDIISKLPRFISEYVASKYMHEYGDRNRVIEMIIKFIEEYYPDPKDKDKILNQLKQHGKVSLLDEYKVEVDLKKNMYFLHIPNLQIRDGLIKEDIVKRYERILSGLWGIGVIEYRPELIEEVKNKRFEKPPFTPLILIDFEPFQIYNVDLKMFIEGRREFTLNEWIDLLIISIGLNPSMYTEEQKVLLLARLIPLIESNVNLAEFGPKATGKTYLYRNISPYTRIYAGGTISAARLFYDARLKVVGDIGTRDVVIFDEVTKVRFNNQDEVVAKLKDYMVDGMFERGPLARAYSTCSLVFIGNVDLNYIHTLDAVIGSLPNFMKDTAFLDRIHGLIPGWKLPKISQSNIHLAMGYGLSADYFSEVLHRMRTYSYDVLVDQHIEFVGDLTIRDEKSLRKLLSGLIKLLFPNCEFDRKELEKVVRVAVELRQNVINILSMLSPHEFPKKRIDVKVKG